MAQHSLLVCIDTLFPNGHRYLLGYWNPTVALARRLRSRLPVHRSVPLFRARVFCRTAQPTMLIRAVKEGIVKTTTLPEQADARSPAGADIRFIMDGETGNMIHCTVPPHQTNRATVHATVSEFWYVLEGHGELWRDNGLESCVTTLVPGTSIDIPVGTAFQYRNLSDVDLKFICIAMPPWPGDSEATFVNGKWQPTI